MNVTGRATLDASADEAFRAICDPATLLAVIPGCESIEQLSADEYAGRVSLRLPAFAGGYRTRVKLVDAVPPHSAGLEGTVEGALGTIRGRAEFTLTDDAGQTRIEYRGRAVIEGPLARLDSRFAEGLAGSLIAQGLRTLNHRLIEARTEAAALQAQRSTEASR